MTPAADPEADRHVLERRARRQRWLAPPLFTGWAAAFVVVLGGRFPALLGPARAYLVLAAAALSLTAAAVPGRGPEARGRSAEALLVQQALRDHVDPGPGLRARVDRQARQLTAVEWMALVYPLLALSFVDDAPWHRPALAVPAFAVVAASAVALAAYTVRSARDARRWLADPPGPPRALPPPGRRAGWIRWVAVIAATCSAVGLLLGVMADRGRR